MLVLDHIGKTYPNGVHALGGVSLEVELGEIVAVIGGSGGGKVSLLRVSPRSDAAIRRGGVVVRHRRTRSGQRRRGDVGWRADRRAACEDRHHLSGAAAVALAKGRRQR